MAALAKLKQVQAQELIDEYFSKCRLAEERRAVESKAVITIQAFARGFIIRRRLLRLTQTALTIQRYWRGYLGRLRGRLALEVHNRALRKAYFNAMATIIQRWWRGFYSRKHIHDYYARKRYLQQVKERNQHIRAELNLEAERAIIMQRQEAEERARKLFQDKLSKLHHLVSTTVQPGIFNSPFSIATGTLPVIMGLSVEEHLKSTLKAQLAMQEAAGGPPASVVAGSGGLAGGGSGKLPPLRGGGGSKGRADPVGGIRSASSTGQRVGDAPAFPAGVASSGSGRGTGFGGSGVGVGGGVSGSVVEVAGRLVPARYTLRQTADFEAVHREALLEEKVHRGEMLSHHPQAFANALGAVKAPFFDLQTNRNLLPYDDPYDPTIGSRGPRFTPTQRSMSKTAFSRYIKKQPVFDKNLAAEAY
ncbi:Spermatoproteinsis-associated protein 17 [Pleodorina starrii]|uniref:Spermatoproteinsis-associated protein 17 n=1 Tax=Pleodorina starrii TaxID=330485 RepID=A0A9W6EYS7_9CHLO|nr:Spermatoproteinsis-associated protein 17 [Pleodorina starrii]GLC50308.1 Spermatoproteinsis-associated protein 17 [Pleodorina starrii]GLC64308.1 Spermatoproteinsis-associated protein 17 [Pleodorina starrii]